MKTIRITCDRCGQEVEGVLDKCKSTGVIITGGYYIVAEGNWQEYQRDDEEYVCDNCMHSDPKYIAIYGDLLAKRVDPPK
jgi:hypothetical protein